MKERTEKTCRGCCETKPITDFALTTKKQKNGTITHYHRSKCGHCFKAQRKNYYDREAARLGRKSLIPPRFDTELGVIVKECRTCHEEKPLDNFHQAYNKRRSQCATCCAEYQRQHPRLEYHRAHALAYHYQHRDKRLADLRAYRAANQERLREYNREYNKANALQRAAYARQRRRTPEGRANAARWVDANREKLRDHYARRRARKYNVYAEVVDRIAIIQRDNATCYLCNRILNENEITLDHIIPLARGGPHAPYNLKVCCLPCNQSKSATMPDSDSYRILVQEVLAMQQQRTYELAQPQTA